MARAVHAVPGTIADAGAFLRGRGGPGTVDLSTLREPYRIEGKKTMAFELVEQLEGEVPDVILYPAGGGTGLIGMWKAFDEMEQLGWIPAGRRPRFVAVQAAGCAPVVRAFHAGEDRTEPWAIHGREPGGCVFQRRSAAFSVCARCARHEAPRSRSRKSP
jgi:threonine synthase